MMEHNFNNGFLRWRTTCRTLRTFMMRNFHPCEFAVVVRQERWGKRLRRYLFELLYNSRACHAVFYTWMVFSPPKFRWLCFVGNFNGYATRAPTERGEIHWQLRAHDKQRQEEERCTRLRTAALCELQQVSVLPFMRRRNIAIRCSDPVQAYEEFNDKFPGGFPPWSRLDAEGFLWSPYN